MINVTLFDTVAEIKISGSPDEFQEGLDWVKDNIDKQDRQFNDGKKVWTIKNPDRYAHLPQFAKAIAERRQQPTLF